MTATTRPRVARARIQSWLTDRIALLAGVDPAGVDPTAPLDDYGITSSQAVSLSGELEEWLGDELPQTLVYQHPSIAALADFLAGDAAADAPAAPAPPARGPGLDAVCVVGMACRFPPDADDPDRFWRDLLDGGHAARPVPPGRWPARPEDDGLLGGFLTDLAGFDAAFFGLSPNEALRMDPRQRLALEVAWAALEHAGLAADGLRGGRTGVFLGMMSDGQYAATQTEADPGSPDDPHFGTGIAPSVLAGRLSYLLDLRGPSLTVDTACSSSLVAVHLAAESLRRGECDVAVAGGVSAVVHPTAVRQALRMNMLAADGRCKAFDADADGFLIGEGCGVVVLQRLGDARRRRGRVLAVLRGSAVNQDGRSNGLTAPNGTAQVAVIRAALDRAGVEPARVGYVEAHGSGTRLGDSIEMDGLQEVFGPGRAAPLVVGAVKTNVGHLLGAAGVAGLIKAVLALDRGVVPANLHHVRPNPAIGWGRCPVLLPTGPTPWPAGAGPRVAGVSSFGWSGTNAHVVLEQAPPERPTAPRPGPRLLTVSGRDADGLAETARRLSAEVAAGRADLADLAFTTQVGRAALEHRAALLVHDRDEAATALTALADAPPDHHVPPGHHPTTALLLPGQGDHHAGMGRGLHATRPAFRAALDECVRLCRELRDLDPAPLLFAERGHHDLFARGAAADPTPVDVVHAAVFAVDYACARLWDELGVRADALLGYSLGEYVAACLSGVFTLPDALALVVDRARLVATAPPGAMLAVALPEDRVADRLTAELSVAAVDGPGLTVVAGPGPAVAGLASRLAAERVAHRRVAASRAMHSASLAPLRSRLADLVAAVPRGEPTVPFLSNATGTWITADQARDPAYWADHLCLPVRFGPAVELLAAEGFGVLLEAGPGRGLSSLATQVLFAAGRTGVVAAPTLPAAGEDRPDAEVLLDTAGRLWSRGVPVDRSRLDPDPARRTTSLPTYPFRHTAFWPEPVAPGAAPTSGARPEPGARAGKSPDPADWCHVPTWRQVPVRAGRVGDGPWLVFADPLGVAATVAERLRAEGAEVFTAHPGDGFRQLDDTAYALDPERPEDHRRLLGHLAERGVRPARVLHALGAAPADDLDAALSRGFLGLLAFAQALGHLLPAHPVELVVVTAGAVAVLGDDLANPEHATLLGLCASLDAEYRTLRCRSVDLDATRPDEAARALLAELGQPAEDEPVAWRGRHRWVREWRPHRLDAPERTVWRERGTYLIIGGLGGLGRALATHLAARVAARLVLVCRTPLPPRDRWPDLAAGSEAVRAVLELERLGAEVVVEAADVADADRLREVVDRAVRRFGALHGVVHAAGVPGAGLVRDKGRDQALAVLRPKVHGTAALLDALRGVPVDFVALYSSSVVAVPGVGESDYTAANAYLDARAAGGADVPVVSIAWGPWRSDSWQAEVFADAPELGARVRSYRDEFGVTEDEGVELLHRALASGLRQVLVLPEGLAATRRRWAELFTAAPATRPAGQRFARPALRTPYVAPRGEVERHIARVWGEHLGVDRVGVDDRFFELGGNSLLAMTVVARLERELGVELSAPVLFERPTVAELAALLDPAGRAGGQVDEAGARGQDRRRRAAARRRGVRGG